MSDDIPTRLRDWADVHEKGAEFMEHGDDDGMADEMRDECELLRLAADEIELLRLRAR